MLRIRHVAAPLLAVLLLCVACARQPEPPPTLAGLPLAELVEGVDAQRALERMHQGPSRPPERSHIASYAGPGGAATLYVSAYGEAADAAAALERMVEAIRRGPSPFTAPEAAGPGGQVWRMQGLGLEHAMWVEGTRLIWLQTDLEHLATGVAELRDRY